MGDAPRVTRDAFSAACSPNRRPLIIRERLATVIRVTHCRCKVLLDPVGVRARSANEVQPSHSVVPRDATSCRLIDPNAFTRNRERLAPHELIARSFDRVARRAQVVGRTSDDHAVVIIAAADLVSPFVRTQTLAHEVNPTMNSLGARRR